MSRTTESLTDADTRAELRAALSARHELGPEMDDQLIESFLAKIDRRVQAAAESAAPKPVKAKSKRNPTEIVGTSFGTAIPLMIIAGYFGGSFGIIAVAVMVAVVNLMYFVEGLDLRG